VTIPTQPNAKELVKSQLETGQEQLVDRFGRVVDYVRLSVTDRCDLRCVYCMAEKMTFLPKSQILSLEEITQIAAAFVSLGVKKIRLTGGEPLVRYGIDELVSQIGQLEGIQDFTMTTNGTQLPKYAQALRGAGMNRINISLDTLRADRFKALSRIGEIEKVFAGIKAAQKVGFDKIKLNAVILKGHNDDEILPLVQYAIDGGMDISFIEEMPLGEVDSRSRFDQYCSSDEVREIISKRYSLEPSHLNTGGPSKYWSIVNTNTKVGFISPHSHNFCDTCNRVRVTVEGRLLLCLGQEHSMDLRAIIREHPNDIEILKQALRDSMAIKPKGHDFNLSEQPVLFRHMSVTGG
jgi:cyclic pyranopterin phosphate synthase